MSPAHEFPIYGNPFEQQDPVWQRLADNLIESGTVRVEFVMDMPTLLDPERDRQLEQIRELVVTKLNTIVSRPFSVTYDGGSGGLTARAAFLVQI